MNVCPKEMVESYCPPLEPAIRSGDYRELIWKVADPCDKSDSERKLGYCDENLSCATYNSLGNLEKRITIRTDPVNGTLYVEQLIKDDMLTFTCSVQRKQNKDPLVYQANVSSSVHCEQNLNDYSICVYFCQYSFYYISQLVRALYSRFSAKIYGPSAINELGPYFTILVSNSGTKKFELLQMLAKSVSNTR